MQIAANNKTWSVSILFILSFNFLYSSLSLNIFKAFTRVIMSFNPALTVISLKINYIRPDTRREGRCNSGRLLEVICTTTGDTGDIGTKEDLQEKIHVGADAIADDKRRYALYAANFAESNCSIPKICPHKGGNRRPQPCICPTHTYDYLANLFLNLQIYPH